MSVSRGPQGGNIIVRTHSSPTHHGRHLVTLPHQGLETFRKDGQSIVIRGAKGNTKMTAEFRCVRLRHGRRRFGQIDARQRDPAADSLEGALPLFRPAAGV